MWKHLRQPRRAAVATTERERGTNLAHALSSLVVHSTSSPVAQEAGSIGAEPGRRQATLPRARLQTGRQPRVVDPQLALPLAVRTLL